MMRGRLSSIQSTSTTSRTATTGCPEMPLMHHMAKVLAYTGEPDVIGKILAVMPKGDADHGGCTVEVRCP